MEKRMYNWMIRFQGKSYFTSACSKAEIPGSSAVTTCSKCLGLTSVWLFVS
jgi:hypothetical protein